MIDQHDFAARLQHADKLIERRFRIRHRGDDVLRDHHVENAIAKAELLRIHDSKAVNVAKAVLRRAHFGFLQHRDRQIDAGEAIGPRIIGQRQSGANADFEDVAAYPLGGGDRRLAAAVEHRAEYDVIDGSPAGIGFGDRVVIELRRHDQPLLRGRSRAPINVWPRDPRGVRPQPPTPPKWRQ